MSWSRSRRRLRAVVAASCVMGAFYWGTGCITSPDLTPVDGVPAEAGASRDDAAPPPGADGASDVAVDSDPTDDAARATCLVVCPAAGGTCDGATCVLACPGLASCATGVTCPPGIPCHVTCNGTKVCGTVDCGKASRCKVECNGETACKQVVSTASQTDITCTGKTACPDTRCDGDTCTVQCGAGACKTPEVQCCATTSCTVNGEPGKCK